MQQHLLPLIFSVTAYTVLIISTNAQSSTTCPRLSSSLTLSCTNGRHIRSTCSLSCPLDHRFIGRVKSVTCLSNRQWNKRTSSVRCVRKPPTTLECPSIDNPIVANCTRGRRTGSSCTISCLPNHQLEGGIQLTRCLSTARWRPNLRSVRCKRVADPECPPRPDNCPAMPSTAPKVCPAVCPDQRSCCYDGCFDLVCSRLPPPCPDSERLIGNDCEVFSTCNLNTCPRFPSAKCMTIDCRGCSTVHVTPELGVIPRFACERFQNSDNWPSCLESANCGSISDQQCRHFCPRYGNVQCFHDCACTVRFVDRSTGDSVEDACFDRSGGQPGNPEGGGGQPGPDGPNGIICQLNTHDDGEGCQRREPDYYRLRRCPEKCEDFEFCCPLPCGGTGCVGPDFDGF